MPDSQWPNLPVYPTFTPEQHRAHTSPKGIPYPMDLVPGSDSRKMAKTMMKFGNKPHLKMSKTSRVSKPATRRKRKLK